ncbi:MAG: hypothetical protein WKF43_11225 [Acidimicrobiales bacterium]
MFDGTNSFVVWDDLRSGNWDIYAARINASGTVLNPNGIPLSANAADQTRPTVAFDGTRHLVAWQDERSGIGPDIYGTRVTTLGLPLNPAGPALSTATGDQEQPAVAFDGTNHLVVWQDHRSGTNFDIYGAGVSTAGTVTHAPDWPCPPPPATNAHPPLPSTAAPTWRLARPAPERDRQPHLRHALRPRRHHRRRPRSRRGQHRRRPRPTRPHRRPPTTNGPSPMTTPSPAATASTSAPSPQVDPPVRSGR